MCGCATARVCPRAGCAGVWVCGCAAVRVYGCTYVYMCGRAGLLRYPVRAGERGCRGAGVRGCAGAGMQGCG